ncbi:MAG: serine protease [Oligoflexales bacterium]
MRNRILSAVLGVFALAGCGRQGAHAAVKSALESLQFIKKRQDPSHYVLDLASYAPFSVCGDDDKQPVNKYDGTLGQTKAFVRFHKFPTGALSSQQRRKFCNGALVSPDLFLTASHCVDSRTMNGLVIFNYEEGSNPDDVHEEDAYGISEVVEQGVANDYALLRVDSEPGLKWGWSSVKNNTVSEHELITIIQHPGGRQKEVEVGYVDYLDSYFMNYGDVDTELGSSGSPIRDAKGNIVGIHTNGGCLVEGGVNSGARLDVITDSPLMDQLIGQTLPFASGDIIELSIGPAASRLVLGVRDSDGRIVLVDSATALSKGYNTKWQAVLNAEGSYSLLLSGDSTRSLGAKPDRGEVATIDPAWDRLGAMWNVKRYEESFVVLRATGANDGPSWLAGDTTHAVVGLQDRAVSWNVKVITQTNIQKKLSRQFFDVSGDMGI